MTERLALNKMDSLFIHNVLLKTHMINIGRKIYLEVRSRKDLNHKDLARKVGMTEQAIHKVYNKEHINTSLLFKIAAALDKPVEFFLKESISFSAIPTQMVSESQEPYGIVNEETQDCFKQLDIAKREISYLQEINQLLREKAKK